MSTFGNRLKNIRKKIGFSQEELADKLGLTRSSISKCETDDSFISKENLEILAKNYNVNLNYLIANIGQPFIAPEFEQVKDDLLNEVEKMFKERGL